MLWIVRALFCCNNALNGESSRIHNSALGNGVIVVTSVKTSTVLPHNNCINSTAAYEHH